MNRATSFKKKIVHPITVFLSLFIVFILGPFLFYNIKYMGLVYPNIDIAGTDVGGMAPNSAILSLSESITPPAKINFVNQTQPFELNTNDIDLTYDVATSVERAYNLTRTGNFFLDFSTRTRLLFEHKSLGFVTHINEEKFTRFVSGVAAQITINPVYASIKEQNGAILVDKGIPGSRVDIQQLRITLGHNLSYMKSDDVNIPLTIVDFTLDEAGVESAKARGEKFLGKSLSLKFELQNFDYKENRLLNFINPVGGYNDTALNDAVSKTGENINRDPQNPKFEFTGNKVSTFLPALDGVLLDSQKLRGLLTDSLDKLAASDNKNIVLDIPVVRTPPDVTTDKINNLGIKELIGHGESTYFHSIPGRIFNVNLAASKINGILIKPGDTFSFNQTVGDISKLTGYKEAYIIQNGRTVLGDGGGVCQVSTTLFRSVLNAGLPVLERAAHAYRVGYYEQNSPPGLDATVFAPSPDFKFKNDTPGYILIQAKNNPKKYSLAFELYGTNDGRVSLITKPVISNIKPALPTIYQDDPTISAGTQKQTDYAAAGARVVFNYSVTRSGEEIFKKTFISNYQPWAAVYLKGTGPAI